ncbi:MAG: L,D-transpeptidase [Anaerolineae bacterium]|nr:L,D-transpeptidase [Anaerolineae bacterium]MDW8291750.1 L,D-transpeptidase [Anaerolineae bacterium]
MRVHNSIHRRTLLRAMLSAAALTLLARTPAIAEAQQSRKRWIQVLLRQQRLIAWEGNRMVRSIAVSTGRARTPTPRGRFRIYRKYPKLRMRGPGYDLPNVPYVMFFRAGGYAIHGAYWHNNFGRPMSHGCINLPIGEAAWLYRWAPIGTPVIIQ